MGGYGEEAKFAIYEAMRDARNITGAPNLEANLKEMKLRLGREFIYALAGDRRHPLVARLADREALPDAIELRGWAEEEGLDLVARGYLLDAYANFLADGPPTDKLLVTKLYDLKNDRVGKQG